MGESSFLVMMMGMLFICLMEYGLGATYVMVSSCSFI